MKIHQFYMFSLFFLILLSCGSYFAAWSYVQANLWAVPNLSHDQEDTLCFVSLSKACWEISQGREAEERGLQVQNDIKCL